MKRCNVCGAEKPESEFYIKHGSRDGLCCQCKACAKEQRKLSYNTHKRNQLLSGIGHGTCKQCGSTIFNRGSTYCSQECYREATKRKTGVCVKCGKSFVIDHSYRIYCSKKCFYSASTVYPKDHDFIYNNQFTIQDTFGLNVAGIYKITNCINGKVYIGQSYNIRRRILQHRACSYYGKKGPIYSALVKYGIGNFRFEIIESVPTNTSIERLNDLEKFYIQKYKSNNPHNGYNATEGGEYVRASAIMQKKQRNREFVV